MAFQTNTKDIQTHLLRCGARSSLGFLSRGCENSVARVLPAQSLHRVAREVGGGALHVAAFALVVMPDTEVAEPTQSVKLFLERRSFKRGRESEGEHHTERRFATKTNPLYAFLSTGGLRPSGNSLAAHVGQGGSAPCCSPS